MESADKSCRKGKVAKDRLQGVDEIADFLFGDARQRRKIYHLAETSRVPVFRLGGKLCARPSVLMAWIACGKDAAGRTIRMIQARTLTVLKKLRRFSRAITDALK